MVIKAIGTFFISIRENKLETAIAVILALAVGAAVALLPSPIYAAGGVIALFGALFLFVKYEFGIVVTVMILYMRVSDNLSSYVGIPSIAQPLLILMFGAVFVRMLTTVLPENGGMKAAFLMILYIISYTISMVLAVNSDVSFASVDDLPKDLIIVFLIATVCSNMRMIKNMAKGLSICGLIMGAVVLFQYVTKTYNNPYYGFGRAEIQNITSTTNDFRSAGVIGDPNYFGQIMVALVPLTIICFLNEKKSFQKLLYAACVVFTILGIFTTFSRGAFLGLVIIAALLVRYKKVKPVFLIVGVLAAAIGFSLLPVTYRERIFSIGDLTDTSSVTSEASFRGRLSELLVAIMMLFDYPLIGMGPYNYSYNYASYAVLLGLDSREGRNAHNFFMQIAAEQGLFGLFTIVFGMFVILAGVYRARIQLASRNMKENTDFVVAFMFSFYGFMACAMFIHPAYFRYYWILFGILAAIPNAAQNEIDKGSLHG